jgi:hypothetical protein
MKGMKKFIALFIFSPICITALLCAACSYPIGSLQPDPGLGVTSNYIKVISKHSLSYKVNETFKPADDLEVFGFFGDVSRSIPIEQVVIKIIGDPSCEGEVTVPIQGYVFTSAGTKSVVVSFGTLEDRYDIKVEARTVGNSTGIVIKWPEKS